MPGTRGAQGAIDDGFYEPSGDSGMREQYSEVTGRRQQVDQYIGGDIAAYFASADTP